MKRAGLRQAQFQSEFVRRRDCGLGKVQAYDLRPLLRQNKAVPAKVIWHG